MVESKSAWRSSRPSKRSLCPQLEPHRDPSSPPFTSIRRSPIHRLDITPLAWCSRSPLGLRWLDLYRLRLRLLPLHLRPPGTLCRRDLLPCGFAHPPRWLGGSVRLGLCPRLHLPLRPARVQQPRQFVRAAALMRPRLLRVVAAFGGRPAFLRPVESRPSIAEMARAMRSRSDLSSLRIFLMPIK